MQIWVWFNVVTGCLSCLWKLWPSVLRALRERHFCRRSWSQAAGKNATTKQGLPATAAHTTFGPSPIDALGPFELITNHWWVLQKVTVLPFDQSACHNAARLKSMVIILWAWRSTEGRDQKKWPSETLGSDRKSVEPRTKFLSLWCDPYLIFHTWTELQRGVNVKIQRDRRQLENLSESSIHLMAGTRAVVCCW